MRAVDVPVLQIVEETVEVALVPQEHVQRQTHDQFVDDLYPQSFKKIVEVVSSAPQALLLPW